MDLDALTIRPFRPADQNNARQLILTGLGEHFGQIDAALNPDLGDISGRYIDQGHFFVVAQLGGRMVGTGGLLIEGKEVGRIVRVSVAKESRGQGIGRAIVEHLLGLARERDLDRVLIETNLDWPEAIALYRRCGFVEVARDAVSVYLQRRLANMNIP